MPTATEKLHDIIRGKIETWQKTDAEETGDEWFDLSWAEEEVFGLVPDDMPSLVAVWCAYEVVLDLSHGIDVPPDIVSGVRIEHPWLETRAAAAQVSVEDFQKFAKLFDVPFRKAHAWFVKWQFWDIRNTGVIYKDESRGGREKNEADLPF